MCCGSNFVTLVLTVVVDVFYVVVIAAAAAAPVFDVVRSPLPFED